jgi:hypothetical protein
VCFPCWLTLWKTQMCLVSGSSILYLSNHKSFVPKHVWPFSFDFFLYKWQCTKKGFKNIFNEEYKLNQPKETFYIFKIQIAKMIIVLVYSKNRSSRMPMYVWDELYFFKGSYSIRITQWSSKLFTENAYLKK